MQLIYPFSYTIILMHMFFVGMLTAMDGLGHILRACEEEMTSLQQSSVVYFEIATVENGMETES